MQVGHATDRGMVREANEDSYLVLTRPALAAPLTALLAVADGMGGHQAGEVASGEVVRTLNELFSSTAYQDRVGHSPERDDYYVVVLKEVLEQVNDHLYQLSGTHPEWNGMGSTGSVALFADEHLYVGHVGDSRVYLLRDGQLQRLTQDHTWVTEQVASGAMTPQQAAVDRRRSQLTRGLGSGPVLRVDRTIHDVRPGDTVLLCSDGLTGVVGDHEIAQHLASAPPQPACDRLVELARQRGGPDNITAVAGLVVAGEVNGLPRGRAFGPAQKDTTPELRDTLKIVLPKAGRPAGRRVSPRRARLARQGLSRPIQVGLLACASSLLIAAAGWVLLRTLPDTAMRDLWELGALFACTVAGAMVGLWLSRWLSPRPRAGHGRKGSGRPARAPEPRADVASGQIPGHGGAGGVRPAGQ